MPIRILFLLLFSLGIHLTVNGQEVLQQPIRCQINAVDLADALRQLSECSTVDIAFSSSTFSGAAQRSVQLTVAQLGEGLDQLLADQGVGYRVRNGRIILFRENAVRYTFSGYLEEEGSGERLISATVFCDSLGQGTLTNEYGYFSLELPAGVHDLTFRYLGFLEKRISVTLDRNQLCNVVLTSANYLEAVVVTPDSLTNPFATADEQGNYELSPEMIRLTPSLAGEPDPVQAAQLLPGIHAGSDGLGGMQVRGGDTGHNILLMDGVPIYIPYHAMGLFSVYNGRTVQSAKVLTGSFPARYGGSLASVFDLRIRDGNRYRWQAEGGSNLSNAHLLVEGPLAKGKASLLLAGRINHSNVLYESMLERSLLVSTENELVSTYSDYNLKINYQFSKRDRLYLSWYQGGDVLSANDSLFDAGFFASNELNLNWGNTIAAVRWNHLFSDRLFMNTSFTYSVNGYEYALLLEGLELDVDEPEGLEEFFFTASESTNTDAALRVDMDYWLNAQHRWRAGIGLLDRSFVSALEYFELDDDLTEEPLDDIDDFAEFIEKQNQRAGEAYIYLEDHWQPNGQWQVTMGLRSSIFAAAETGYARLEPRMTITHQLSDDWHWQFSAGRMVQYLHLVPSSALQSPTDLWRPVNADILPQSSWQVEGKVGRQLGENSQLSLGGYYKTFEHQYRFPILGNVVDFTIEDIDEFLLPGRGWSQGVELFLDHHADRQGWVASYVLAASMREFEETNEEMPFPHAYDSRHQFKVLYYRQLSPHWQLSAQWRFHSANPQRAIPPAFLGAVFPEEELAELFEFNLRRAPAYHRLDCNVKYVRQRGDWRNELTLGLINAYNRPNVSFYELFAVNASPMGGGAVNALPFLSTLSYSIRWGY